MVGSGLAGMAAAQQLARAGHNVVVYEKQDGIGGLLRYGIPDFKLEKQVIKRRMGQMKAEGVNSAPIPMSAGRISRRSACSTVRRRRVDRWRGETARPAGRRT